MRQKIYEFMYGRYGMDTLGKVLTYGGLGVYLVGAITRVYVIILISTMMIVFSIFRMFSKNIFARQEENRKFMHIVNYYKLKWNERKTHHVYICKGCGKYVRYPKHKGKIEVTCKACGTKKIKRS